MEKVMYPFLLFSKKRYACLYYEVPEKPKGIDCKGIQVVRRDNCPLVKDICNPVLDKIMYDKDITSLCIISVKKLCMFTTRMYIKF